MPFFFAGVDILQNSLLSSFQMGAEVDKPAGNQVTYCGVFMFINIVGSDYTTRLQT